MKSVSDGPVTNHFSPLRTQSPVAGSRSAVEASVRASEPWPASVIAYEPLRSPRIDGSR